MSALDYFLSTAEDDNHTALVPPLQLLPRPAPAFAVEQPVAVEQPELTSLTQRKALLPQPEVLDEPSRGDEALNETSIDDGKTKVACMDGVPFAYSCNAEDRSEHVGTKHNCEDMREGALDDATILEYCSAIDSDKGNAAMNECEWLMPTVFAGDMGIADIYGDMHKAAGTADIIEMEWGGQNQHQCGNQLEAISSPQGMQSYIEIELTGEQPESELELAESFAVVPSPPPATSEALLPTSKQDVQEARDDPQHAELVVEEALRQNLQRVMMPVVFPVLQQQPSARALRGLRPASAPLPFSRASEDRDSTACMQSGAGLLPSTYDKVQAIIRQARAAPIRNSPHQTGQNCEQWPFEVKVAQKESPQQSSCHLNEVSSAESTESSSSQLVAEVQPQQVAERVPISNDLATAQKAVMDLRQMLRQNETRLLEKEKIIAQKEALVVQANQQLDDFRKKNSFQPKSPREFDQIAVINDLRQMYNEMVKKHDQEMQKQGFELVKQQKKLDETRERWNEEKSMRAQGEKVRDAELKMLQQEKEQLQQTLNERMALAGANDRAREALMETSTQMRNQQANSMDQVKDLQTENKRLSDLNMHHSSEIERLAIEKEMLSSALKLEADSAAKLAEEVEQVRSERAALQQKLLISDDLEMMVQLMKAQEHLKVCQAELEHEREESAALKAVILVWHQHKDDPDYRGYLEVETGAWKDKITEIMSQNQRLIRDNARLTLQLASA